MSTRRSAGLGGVDAIGGALYWTSATGHLVYRASYVGYNATIARRERLSEPVYKLADDAHSADRYDNQTVEVVVSADGLAGDFGKDPSVMPILLSAEGSDPDNGDTTFGNGDVIRIQFDRPTNVSSEILTDGVQPQAYVDSLFRVSEPLGFLQRAVARPLDIRHRRAQRVAAAASDQRHVHDQGGCRPTRRSRRPMARRPSRR